MPSILKLDLRSLALVRFLLGILAFADILNRFPQIVAFYSDKGILPRWLLIDQFQISWKVSLFYLIGDPLFVYAVSAVGLVAAFFVMIGLRTRLSAFIVWLILMSFHARFPEINHGGDNLIRLMFFMAMFLPMNAYYSVDSCLQDNKVKKPELGSVFTAAWVFHILYIYFFTFYYKWTPTWFRDYNSVYYAMSLDMFTSPLGDWVLQHSALMKFMSFFSFWLEGLGPFLVLIPYRRDFNRGIAVILFWALHLGIWTTMYLGNFPPGCLILWCAMIPGAWWDYLLQTFYRKKERAVLYYDPECGFCRKFSFIIVKMFMLKDVEVLSGDANSNVLATIKLEKSWVVVKDGQNFLRYKAFEKLLSHSLIPVFRLAEKIQFSAWGGDGLYKIISSFRYTWGVLLNKISFSPIRLETSRTIKVFGILFIALTFSWNLEGSKIFPEFDLKSPVNEVVFALQLNQQWNMFAPNPRRDDGWFITEAKLQDGQTWDILNDQNYSEERPSDLAGMYPSSQWRKFYSNLNSDRNQTYLLWFGKYLCRKWNDLENRNNKVQSYRLIFMREMTVPPGEAAQPIEKVIIWNHDCFN